MTLFEYIIKHLEVCQKYAATRHIFNSLLGVWKCGQTRSFVFDILHHKSGVKYCLKGKETSAAASISTSQGQFHFDLFSYESNRLIYLVNSQST